MLVAALLAACGGGISQDELDEAVAAKDAALAQVATLQSQLSAAQTAKTQADAALAAAEAQIAELESLEDDLEAAQAATAAAQQARDAAQADLNTARATLTETQAELAQALANVELLLSGGMIPPTLSFTASEYTNADYGFSFKYNSAWTATWSGEGNVVSFGDATYYDPSIRLLRVAANVGATLADAVQSQQVRTIFNATDVPVATTIEETEDAVTNRYRTTAASVTFEWENPNGSIAHCKAFGLIKDGNWFIMLLTINSGWNMSLNTVYPDEVFETWNFD